MRKILLFVAAIALLVGCQQKQEPTNQPPQPGASMQQSAAEIKMLQDAVQKDPGNVNGWIKLGNIFMDSQRCSEAVDAYQKALSIDPKNVDVRVDMGTCYRQIGKSDKAVEEYKKAIEINPKHAVVHRNLAVTLAFDLNNKAEAIKEFEKYLEVNPLAQDASQVRETVKQLKAGK